VDFDLKADCAVVFVDGEHFIPLVPPLQESA
jgi:hypothetical protein